MKFHDVVTAAEEHPVGAGVAIFIVGLFILWLLGFFSKAPAAQSGNDQGLAAAYYAAEQAQMVAGTELQMAQSNNVAQTAQAKIAADAAVQINAQSVTGAVTANSQNTTAAVDIVHTQADVAKTAYDAQVMSVLAPLEMPYTGGGVLMTHNAGGYTIGSGNLYTDPNTLRAQGFDETQIANYIQHVTTVPSFAS